MAIQSLGQTDNFTIRYQDSYAHALARAQALQSTVERDFSKLGCLIAPKVFEPVRCQLGVTHRVLNVSVPEPSLQHPCCRLRHGE
jgi:hypothetical protein